MSEAAIEQVPAPDDQVIVAGSTVGYILSCGDDPDAFNDARWDRTNPASPTLNSAGKMLALLVRPATVVAIDAHGVADLDVLLNHVIKVDVHGRRQDHTASTPGTWHRV